MRWLLYVFGVYLAVCYLWTMYVAIRLYMGKRLRILATVGRARPGKGPSGGEPATAEPEPVPNRARLAPTKPKAAA